MRRQANYDLKHLQKQARAAGLATKETFCFCKYRRFAPDKTISFCKSLRFAQILAFFHQKRIIIGFLTSQLLYRHTIGFVVYILCCKRVDCNNDAMIMPSIDSLKLLFLVTLTFASLSTLFTSQSIAMQNPSMRILTVTATATRGGEGGGNMQQQRFCMTPRRNMMKNCDRKLKKGTATTVHNNSTLNNNNGKNAIHSEEEEEQQQQQQCDTYRNNVQKCQKVAKRAFRDINMKGCPKQIKLVTLCEDEWCSGHFTTGTYIGNHNHQTSTSCQKECAGVQDSLELCIKQRIMIVFKQNGLNEDGTTTTMTK